MANKNGGSTLLKFRAKENRKKVSLEIPESVLQKADAYIEFASISTHQVLEISLAEVIVKSLEDVFDRDKIFSDWYAARSEQNQIGNQNVPA